MLIEIEGKRFLTDPGSYSKGFEDLTDLAAILITHEHADHLHTEALATLHANNPRAMIITNTGVGKILETHGIEHTVVEGNSVIEVAGVRIEAYDGTHAEIFEEVGQVQNTGYFIGESLFYPGDAYTDPKRLVPVLALPVSGPWCRSADAIRYAVALKPERAFPVHDAVLNEKGIELVHGLFERVLASKGVTFMRLKDGETIEC